MNVVDSISSRALPPWLSGVGPWFPPLNSQAFVCSPMPSHSLAYFKSLPRFSQNLRNILNFNITGQDPENLIIMRQSSLPLSRMITCQDPETMIASCTKFFYCHSWLNEVHLQCFFLFIIVYAIIVYKPIYSLLVLLFVGVITNKLYLLKFSLFFILI